MAKGPKMHMPFSLKKDPRPLYLPPPVEPKGLDVKSCLKAAVVILVVVAQICFGIIYYLVYE